MKENASLYLIPLKNQGRPRLLLHDQSLSAGFLFSEIAPGAAVWTHSDFLHRSRRHDRSACQTSLGAHVDDPVGIADHVKIMLDDDDRRPAFDQSINDFKKRAHIKRMQSDGGLVEHKYGALLRASDLSGKLKPLSFTARQIGRSLAQRQVPKPQIVKQWNK